MRIMVSLIFLFASTNYAEIHKEATQCETGICMHWWPILPRISGWHQDQKASLYYSSNSLAPDSFTFNNAEVVMYASALFKERMPEVKTIKSFIEDDKKAASNRNKSIEIKAAEGIKTADGQILASLTFSPRKEGNWEQVAYGEEIDKEGNGYFLVFTISSRTRAGFEKERKSFKDLIGNYRKDAGNDSTRSSK